MPLDTHRSKIWLFWLLVLALSMATMLYFVYSYPRTVIGPKQPIPFSHRVHAGVKRINCLFCHSFANRAPNPGIPSLQKCFFCHQYIIPRHPEILKEREHYMNNDPVEWTRIFYVPDFVKFRHQPHIRFAKLECFECHGNVEQMDRLIPKDFQMGFCIDCHRLKKAQTDCWLACHH